MNNKDTFNFVKKHLLKQNAQAQNAIGCRYRDDIGRKCAIGCLIKDEHYDVKLEGSSLNENVNGSDLLAKKNGRILSALRASGCDASLKLLARLQLIHDSYEPEFWALKLNELEAEIS